MKQPEENPPRQPGETAIYEDDPFELGEVDDSRFVIVQDFLPPPEKLVFKDPRRKVTITLDQTSIDFFQIRGRTVTDSGSADDPKSSAGVCAAQEAKRFGPTYHFITKPLLRPS